MTRAGKALIVAVVAAVGLWGCAQGNGNQAERLRSAEKKYAQLEEDYKAVAAERDGLRKRLAAKEEEHAKLRQEFEAQQTLVQEREALTKERDELIRTLGTRTGERDAAQTQLEQVRKGLRNLLGQAEAAVGGPSVSAAPAAKSGT